MLLSVRLGIVRLVGIGLMLSTGLVGTGLTLTYGRLNWIMVYPNWLMRNLDFWVLIRNYHLIYNRYFL
jgi:hypothetical protein